MNTRRQGIAALLSQYFAEAPSYAVQIIPHKQVIKAGFEQSRLSLHRYTSHISRLWSTVYDMALDVTCSVLDVVNTVIADHVSPENRKQRVRETSV